MQIWNSVDHKAARMGQRCAGAILSPSASGLFAATRIATSFGWRQAGSLMPGDMVLTFDAGLQPLVSVEVSSLDVENTATDPSEWPLFVPGGTLGNQSEVIVMPGQAVLLQSEIAADLLGHAFVMIRAADLDSVSGIFRVAPTGSVEVAVLRLAEEQVIFGAGGALFACEGREDVMSAARRGVQGRYPVLTSSEADLVLSQEIVPAGPSMVQATGHPAA